MLLLRLACLRCGLPILSESRGFFAGAISKPALPANNGTGNLISTSAKRISSREIPAGSSGFPGPPA